MTFTQRLVGLITSDVSQGGPPPGYMPPGGPPPGYAPPQQQYGAPPQAGGPASGPVPAPAYGQPGGHHFTAASQCH